MLHFILLNPHKEKQLLYASAADIIQKRVLRTRCNVSVELFHQTTQTSTFHDLSFLVLYPLSNVTASPRTRQGIPDSSEKRTSSTGCGALDVLLAFFCLLP